MITRIRELLDSKELSPTQFADLIGVGRPVVSHMLSERNKPSLDVVQRIIGAFPEISLPWLLSGTGNMLNKAIAASPTPGVASNNDSAAIPTPETKAASRPATAPPTPPSVAEQPPSPAASPVEAPFVATAKPMAPPKPAAGPTTNTVSTPVSAPVPATKPFRAARFVPAATATTPAAVTSLPPALPQSEPLPSAPPAKAAVAAPAAFPSTEVPAASLPPVSNPVKPVGFSLLPEPGKAIRRIVIFYQDGSFADYQPE